MTEQENRTQIEFEAKEILGKQLALLSEYSRSEVTADELCALTEAILKIAYWSSSPSSVW